MDARLQEVLLDYGLEGYGLYFYCLELIVNKISSGNLNFELEHDARIIARNTGSSVQKIEEMMRRFIELGLFENSLKGKVTCIKLLNRLDSSMTGNSKMRELINSAKDQHHGSVKISHDSVMQEEKRKEEKRLEQIRKDNFDYLWKNQSLRKVGKDKASKAFINLCKTRWNTEEKIIKAVAVIVHDIDHRIEEVGERDSPFLKMHLSTYLNGKRWQDEETQVF